VLLSVYNLIYILYAFFEVNILCKVVAVVMLLTCDADNLECRCTLQHRKTGFYGHVCVTFVGTRAVCTWESQVYMHR